MSKKNRRGGRRGNPGNFLRQDELRALREMRRQESGAVRPGDILGPDVLSGVRGAIRKATYARPGSLSTQAPFGAASYPPQGVVNSPIDFPDLDPNDPDVKAGPGHFKEVGQTGLRRWGGIVYEEFLRELSGGKAYKVYREMRDNDPTVGAMLFAIEMLLRQVSWQVVPGGDEDGYHKTAEFIEQCMHDMSSSWAEFIGEALSMLTYGWAWHEIVYKQRDGKESAFDDGLIGWKKLPIRAQDTLYLWSYDEDGVLRGMIQMSPPDYTLVFIPIEKSILFRPSNYKDNPEGRSVLRAAYMPWYYVRRLRQIEAIGIERDLAGLPVLHAPERLDIFNDKDPEMLKLRQSAERMVRHVKRDEYEGLVLPFGWEFELVSAGGRRSIDVSATIERYKREIAMTALADFIMIGHESTGSFALATTKTEVFETAMAAWLTSIADILNKHAIPRLLRLNPSLMQDKFPRITAGEIAAPDIHKLGSYVQQLVSVGAITPSDTMENFLRQIAGLPPMDGTERLAITPVDEQYREISQDTDQQPGEPGAPDSKPNEPGKDTRNASPSLAGEGLPSSPGGNRSPRTPGSPTVSVQGKPAQAPRPPAQRPAAQGSTQGTRKPRPSGNG